MNANLPSIDHGLQWFANVCSEYFLYFETWAQSSVLICPVFEKGRDNTSDDNADSCK